MYYDLIFSKINMSNKFLINFGLEEIKLYPPPPRKYATGDGGPEVLRK